MSASRPIGTIAQLWRFPVKSMAGETIAAADIGPNGLLGDRGYALIDSESGLVVSAKSVKRFPDLMCCRATFIEAPRAGCDLPPVRITLPDGASATSDSDEASRLLSSRFGRDVKLARSAPSGDGTGLPHSEDESVDAGAPRSFFDQSPLSFITSSTLDRLKGLCPESAIDPRRFRMNLVINTAGAGFRENAWIGRTLAAGGAVRLIVSCLDPRCVMITLAQDNLPKGPEILRTLAEHNRVPVGDMGPVPCAGAYASIGAGGTVRIGDSVHLS